MEIINPTILFLGGILAGLYGSSVGSGGLVSIPFLVLTGIPMHMVIATNRLGVVFLEFASAAKFLKEKKLDLKLGVIFGIFAAAGSYIGSNIVIGIEEKYLKLITAVLLAAVFLFLFFKNKLGIQEKKVSQKHWAIAAVSIFLLGIYGGFFGTGFGTFSAFIFALLGLSFVESAAISRVVGCIMSIAAAAVFISNGLVNYPYAIAIGLGFSFGGWIGAGIGVKKGNDYIRILFLAIISVTIAKLIYDFLK